MKRVSVFITCLMCSTVLFGQGGVDFRNLTFDEALARAKAEKKWVFMNCYKTRFGPCEFMAATIFPQEKAGAFFNPRFVSVKFDMEQGEGKELKTKLGVRDFPTFFIIRPDGTVQHRIVGSSGLDKLIKRVKSGLNEKTSLLYLTREYEKGKMNKKKLMVYYQALSAAYDLENAGKIYDELMNTRLTEKDKLKADFWPLFKDPKCTIGTPDFNLILANIPVFEKNIGKEELDAYLFGAYHYVLSGYIARRDFVYSVAPDNLKKQIDQLNMSRKDDLLFQCDLAAMVVNRNTAELVSLLEEKAATPAYSHAMWHILSALRTLDGQFSKPELMRIAVAGDKITANPEYREIKDYLERSFEQHKNRLNAIKQKR